MQRHRSRLVHSDHRADEICQQASQLLLSTCLSPVVLQVTCGQEGLIGCVPAGLHHLDLNNNTSSIIFIPDENSDVDLR